MAILSKKHPPLSRTGEWAVALTSLWFLGGLFLDGWAHNHVPELESFFTPWHAAFYSGYFALLAALLIPVVQNRKDAKLKLRTWKDAVPAGYLPAVTGAIVFAAGGVGDMLWHEIFGIENDIEALHSPTHLILATGMTMMLSGGLLSWWRKTDKQRSAPVQEQLPMVISAACVFTMLTFMTQYAHFVDMLPAGVVRPRSAFYPQALPMAGFILHFAMLMGVTFLVMRRGRPPFGFVTAIFTANVFAMGMMRENALLWIGAAFTGVVADYMLQRLYPLEKHMNELRVFAFGVPAVFLCYYFAYMIALEGTWWSVHMWTGSAFLAGITGLLLSFLAWPPREA